MFMFFLLYKVSVRIRDLDMFISALSEGDRVGGSVDFSGDEVCMNVYGEPCGPCGKRGRWLFTYVPLLSTGL